MEKIVENLFTYMKEQHLTQNEIAMMLNVSKNTIGNWKKGQPVSTENAKVIEKIIKDYTNTSDKSKCSVSRDTIQNTPELRECIKDAMMKNGITSASALCRAINYDSSNTIERLLAGKLNWFPDMLSAVLDVLHIQHDSAPMTPTERSLLKPEGIYNEGAILVRPIPVVEWANAAGFLGTVTSNTTVLKKWDPETTEVVPAPVGVRKDTIAFRVTGESMEPAIQDGDIIYCHPVMSFDEISNGKVVVIQFTDDYSYCPDCVVCKRLTKANSTIILTSDNSARGRIFSDVTQDKISWLGVVTSKFSNL